jgi:hypothetical protein
MGRANLTVRQLWTQIGHVEDGYGLELLFLLYCTLHQHDFLS